MTFENTKSLQDYITTFRLNCIPGENESLGSSCFKAAAKMLSKSDLPTDLLPHYLCGMAACGNEEFRAICSSQLGFLSTPMYEEWSLGKAHDIWFNLMSLLPSWSQSMRLSRPPRLGLGPHALTVCLQQHPPVVLLLPEALPH
eukprot:CCRYP_006633-RA/>CCRYP_006633-RA protein AED:0.42 eAED:0.42 QI:0/-1/0/1/-1/1/1/0/142